MAKAKEVKVKKVKEVVAEVPEIKEEPKVGAPKVVERPIDGPIKVVLPNGTFRVYTRAEHGPHYKILAENYRVGQGGKFV